jgi:hypothetical protein
VTVKVGPSGLVGFWIAATLSSTGGNAEVWLKDCKGEAPQLVGSGLPVPLYSKPESDSGTNIFNAGMSTELVGPGTCTFKLYYDDTAGTGKFSEIELVVVPL